MHTIRGYVITIFPEAVAALQDSRVYYYRCVQKSRARNPRIHREAHQNYHKWK